MQHNDSLKRRRSSPIKTASGGSGNVSDRPIISEAAPPYPVLYGSNASTDIPRSVSHDPHVAVMIDALTGTARQSPTSAITGNVPPQQPPMYYSAGSYSNWPTINENRKVDDFENQHHVQQLQPHHENNSPSKKKQQIDEENEEQHHHQTQRSSYSPVPLRDTTVQLNVSGGNQTEVVVLDGGKPVSSDKELIDLGVDDGDSPVETVRTQRDDDDDDENESGSSCCGCRRRKRRRRKTGKRRNITVQRGVSVEEAVQSIHGGWIGIVETSQVAIHGFIDRNSKPMVRAIKAFAIIAFFTYLAVAVFFYTFPNVPGVREVGSQVVPIVGFTAFVVVVLLLRFLAGKFGDRIDSAVCSPLRGPRFARPCQLLKWFIYIGVIVGIGLFISIDIGTDFKRLTSLGGMVILLALGFVTSTNPSKVKWRPVFWGLGLQFALGVLILRWRPGYQFFVYLGDGVRVFLEYADAGSEFVFGEKGVQEHEMAMKVFPIIIYFSAVINIFYYWGLMQFVVCKIAWLMQYTMGTTAIESLNAACNIFIGMAESTVIMRPFLPKLTKSELHAVMTGGFATVAGSYIALLVSIGASPQHLLSAAIMSAPAALAMAKLSYPEVEQSHTKTEEDVKIENFPARNIVEAASNGAVAAIKVVASVAANLIALLGLISFLNSALKYIGLTIGVADLTFERICSVVFWPLAVIMGVEVVDAFNVAQLLGVKIFADELIAFQQLVRMVCAEAVQDRSMVIATYACCGFGSIAAIGVYIGALISVAPERRGDITEVAFRAVINGNIAGFLTACIAGFLYTGKEAMEMAGGPELETITCANKTILALSS